MKSGTSEAVERSEALAKNLGRTLGLQYEDCVSGFRGVCTGVIFYLYKDNMLELTPRGLTKDGATMSPEWFSVDRLRVVE